MCRPVLHRQRLWIALLNLTAIASLGIGCSSEPPANTLEDGEQVVPGVEIANLNATSTEKPSKEPIQPACVPTLNEGKLTLDGIPLKISVEEPPGYSVFPLDSEHILVAKKHRWDVHPLNPPKGTLWSIRCERPQESEVYYQRADSDFGHAVLSHDGHALFFTSSSGIKRLFLATKTVQPVTDSPRVSELCWTQGEEGYPQSMVDIVRALDRSSQVLTFERGSHCGIAATWISRMWLLSLDIPDTESPAMRSPRPFTTVTRDASGQLWAGDGGRCDQPGVQDTQTPGFLFVSRNDGTNWDALPIKVGQAMAHTAVRSIRTDRTRPGHLVLHAARCTNPLGTYGGLLYMSRNAGKSWRRIPIMRQAGYPSDGGIGVVDFELIDGSVDRIRVWNEAKETYETHTTGSKWLKVDNLPLPKVETRAHIEAGQFDASPDGIVLHKGTEMETTKFPSRPAGHE